MEAWARGHGIAAVRPSIVPDSGRRLHIIRLRFRLSRTSAFRRAFAEAAGSGGSVPGYANTVGGIKEGAPEALVPILGIAHRVLGPSRFPDYAATVTERSCVVDS